MKKVFIVWYDNVDSLELKEVFNNQADAEALVAKHQKFHPNGQPYYNAWSWSEQEVKSSGTGGGAG